MTRTLLIVEDDQNFQDLIIRAVEGMDIDFKIELAVNMSMAKRIARMLDIDIFLIDIMLPDGSGLELADELRQDYPYTPFIIESTINDINVVNSAYDDIHCLSFLRKPFSENDVRKSINNVIGMQSLHEKTINNKMLTIYKDVEYYLEIKRIIYIDLDYNTTRIHMLDEETRSKVEPHEILRYSLKKILTGIDNEKDLLRCHKSYIINPSHIKQFHPNYQIELYHIPKLIPIGRDYRNVFGR